RQGDRRLADGGAVLGDQLEVLVGHSAVAARPVVGHLGVHHHGALAVLQLVPGSGEQVVRRVDDLDQLDGQPLAGGAFHVQFAADPADPERSGSGLGLRRRLVAALVLLVPAGPPRRAGWPPHEHRVLPGRLLGRRAGWGVRLGRGHVRPARPGLRRGRTGRGRERVVAAGGVRVGTAARTGDRVAAAGGAGGLVPAAGGTRDLVPAAAGTGDLVATAGHVLSRPGLGERQRVPD